MSIKIFFQAQSVAKIEGLWDQDGIDNLEPFISSDSRKYTANRSGITITEDLVANPFRFIVSISNFSYTLTASGDPIVRGGTITGLSISLKKGKNWTSVATSTGFKVSAKSLYDAATSEQREDDIAFYRSLFSGNDVFNLSGQNDVVRSYDGNDTLNGNGGDDFLDGGNGIDTIIGGTGKDSIIGGVGKDQLTGGAGLDKFIYKSVDESGVGSKLRDIITDFKGSKEKDRIDLSEIDAFTGAVGDQAFVYIGSKAFTGTKGEVRFSGGVLQINTGTDKIADMEIALTGVTSFSKDFLVL